MADPTLLLCGELAYNPERVTALAAHGFRLTGRWIDDPLPFMTTGPLPYVAEEVPGERPDAVLALLNWRAVPLAAQTLRDARRWGVPLAWVFKEAPQRSRIRGTWDDLATLHREADLVAYCSAEEREFMALQLPDARDPDATLVVDGDLPPAARADGAPAPRLRDADGAVHTVLAGRPYGFDAALARELAAHDVHLHVHGTDDVGELRAAAPGHVHVHPPVPPDRWAAELSRYDAGWLHPHRSANGGDLRDATWDDLNVPARFATYVAAGLPVVQQANPGHRVATQELVRRHGCGVLLDGLGDLRDHARLEAARAGALAARDAFSFEPAAELLARRLRALLR